MDLEEYNANNFKNTYIDSEVPSICKDEPCVLGIDEAGRGPVLGPMVYGVCYLPLAKSEDLKNLGVDDSKVLTEEQREKLFGLIHKNSDYLGWSIEVLSPMFISNCMFKRPKVSLNEVSHNSAINLVKRVLAQGVKLAEIYVDTVGPPEKYEAKLSEIFPTIKCTVAKKADSLYPSVSAASIAAKVCRDRALKAWKFPEGIDITNWGSGYPGDAVTKNFLVNTINPVFGFPGIVRFSWSTAEKIIVEKCVTANWEEEEDEKKDNTPSVLSFFAASKQKPGSTSVTAPSDSRPPPSKKRCHYFFTDRCLKSVETF